MEVGRRKRKLPYKEWLELLFAGMTIAENVTKNTVFAAYKLTTNNRTAGLGSTALPNKILKLFIERKKINARRTVNKLYANRTNMNDQ